MVKQNKWNDRFRHKDVGIKVYERKLNRRSRYSARHLDRSVEACEALLALKIERVIVSLCREAGIPV